jgi:hypothetical protein
MQRGTILIWGYVNTKRLRTLLQTKGKGNYIRIYLHSSYLVENENEFLNTFCLDYSNPK